MRHAQQRDCERRVYCAERGYRLWLNKIKQDERGRGCQKKLLRDPCVTKPRPEPGLLMRTFNNTHMPGEYSFCARPIGGPALEGAEGATGPTWQGHARQAFT